MSEKRIEKALNVIKREIMFELARLCSLAKSDPIMLFAMTFRMGGKRNEQRQDR